MKQFVRCVVIIFSLLLPLISMAAVTSSLGGEVSRVIDGDSIVVDSKGKSYEIRLWGVDAPEHDQPYGYKAKKHCSKLISGRNVRVEVKTRDGYNRLVGVVYLNRKNINEELVRQGSAWVYKKYCTTSICRRWQKLESSARRDRKGLWNTTSVIAPWKWRH